jgi:hypothetical protein
MRARFVLFPINVMTGFTFLEYFCTRSCIASLCLELPKEALPLLRR